MDFQQGTGAHISPVDPRDWKLASVGATTAFPDSCFIDVSNITPRMQGKIGSCVGNTFEEIIYKITGSTEVLSWRQIYAICKALEGTVGYEQFTPCVEGTYPALASQVVRKFGVMRAKFCPNDIALDHETFVFNRTLNSKEAIIKALGQEAWDDAQTRKSGADFAVPVTLDGIKQAITYAAANNGAVAILRMIGDTYWKDANGNHTWDKNLLLPIRPTNVIVSGHEELLYGFETEAGTGRVKIHWLNHWSSQWADNGKAWEYADVWLPYIVEMRVVIPTKPFLPVDNFKHTFTKKMKYADKGDEVLALQHCLKIEGLFPYTQPLTGNFGNITMKAVNDFQMKYKSEILTPLGLSNPTGMVGDMTIKKLNQLYAQ